MLRRHTKTADDTEDRVEALLRLVAIDDQLRDLHGRTDTEARQRRDQLLDERLHVATRT